MQRPGDCFSKEPARAQASGIGKGRKGQRGCSRAGGGEEVRPGRRTLRPYAQLGAPAPFVLRTPLLRRLDHFPLAEEETEAWGG